MGYGLPPWFVHRLAMKPDIFRTLLSLCTHFIVAGYFRSLPGMDAFILTSNLTMDAALPLTLRRQRILYTTS
jgi:hypothetical protein